METVTAFPFIGIFFSDVSLKLILLTIITHFSKLNSNACNYKKRNPSKKITV